MARLGVKLEEAQTSVENTKNLLRKNNIKMWGLKEKVEGDNLYWITGCVGAEYEIAINAPYHVQHCF